jgi:hypothetical protein
VSNPDCGIELGRLDRTSTAATEAVLTTKHSQPLRRVVRRADFSNSLLAFFISRSSFLI